MSLNPSYTPNYCSFHNCLGTALTVHNTNIYLSENNEFIHNQCTCGSFSEMGELGCDITTFNSKYQDNMYQICNCRCFANAIFQLASCQLLKFCVKKSEFEFVAHWHLVCTYSLVLLFPYLVSATMASPPTVTEQALRKLEDQLTCGICLDSYTEPKLLQCFHVFCKQCLERLVV